MANATYVKAKQRALTDAGIQWSTGNIKAVLVRASGGDNPYTFSAAHEFRSSIHDDAHVATSANLGTKTVTDGVADAANVTFAAVAAGLALQAVVLYRDTADKATDELIAYIDSATGLPVTPNGGDITVEWDDGANKIFKL